MYAKINRVGQGAVSRYPPRAQFSIRCLSPLRKGEQGFAAGASCIVAQPLWSLLPRGTRSDRYRRAKLEPLAERSRRGQPALTCLTVHHCLIFGDSGFDCTFQLFTLVLSVEQLTKTYKSGERTLTVVKEISFSIAEGSTCSIVGPFRQRQRRRCSALCAGLDRPSSGTVKLNGIELNSLSEDDLAEIRNQHVGFVFQTFQLIPTLTALENVMVPLELRGETQTGSRAVDLLRAGGSRRPFASLPCSALRR